MWSLTYPALIHCGLALLTAFVQLIITPLPVSILCFVQVATGARDSSHLDRDNTQQALNVNYIIHSSQLNMYVHCGLPMIPLGFRGTEV